VILAREAWRHHGELLTTDPDGVGGAVAERLRTGGGYGSADLAAAEKTLSSWRAELDAVFARVPVIALPTLVGDPPPLDEAHLMYRLRATLPVNLAGLPAVSIPVPRRGRLPASLQLVGPADSEELLLATAARVESALAR
jgi:amidase